MEEPIKNPELKEETPDTYVPRPLWQVWGARIAAVVFAGLVILQILSIAKGGL